MPEASRRHHISSAVVMTTPSWTMDVCSRLAEFAGVEVHAVQNGKVIVTIEGPGTRMMGDTLARVAMLDGVVSANMVYEHSEVLEGRKS
jgi:periplasmic nitrate reductase NapD